jgi:hypothetical protein
MDCGVIVAGELVVAGGDASEVLEPAEHALDAIALAVEGAVVRDGRGAAAGRWDDGAGAALGQPAAQGVGVIGTIGQEMAERAGRRDQGHSHGAVIDVAGAEPQDPRPAGIVGQGVDFGGAAAAGAADRLGEVPPFAPAAERCALMWVASIAPPPQTPLIPVSAWKTSNQTPCRLQRW